MYEDRVPLKAVELILLRFGLLSTAILCWNVATNLWETGDTTRQVITVILCLVCYLVGFALLIALAVAFCIYSQYDRI